MKQYLSSPVVVIVSLVIVMILAGLVFFITVYLLIPESAQGGAPPGISADVATSGPYSLKAKGAESLFSFATSTNCNARIITTKEVAITLGFSDGATSSPTFGHLQAASTTVAYEATVYGCGRITAYSMDSGGAATILTVTETR